MISAYYQLASQRLVIVSFINAILSHVRLVTLEPSFNSCSLVGSVHVYA